MPSFISHIYYGNKFMLKNGIKTPNPQFNLGNLIPDIRFFGKISKEKTHVNFNDPDIENKVDMMFSFNSKNAEEKKMFIKGFIFHNFLDEWWDKQIYIKSSSPTIGLALKLYEDTLLYDQFEYWPEVIQSIIENTDSYSFKGIYEDKLKDWFDLLKEYFEKKIDLNRQLNLFLKYELIDKTTAESIRITSSEFPYDINQKFNTLRVNYNLLSLGFS